MDIDYLESVTARYQGEARVQRLLWIAQQATSTTNTTTNVSAAAWTQLAKHFRETGNVHRTRDLVALLTSLQRTTDPTHSQDHEHHPAALAATAALQAIHAADFPDGPQHPGPTTTNHSSSSSSFSLIAWMTAQEHRNKHTRDALQARLSQAQAHLHKDAIRAAYVALANHELQVGPDPPTEAFHLVLRAKDYCVTRPQTATVSLQILEVALALKNYGSVREYVTKLEHTLDSGWGGANSGAAGGGGANSATATGSGSGSSSSTATAAASSGGVPANWNELAFHRVKVASALEALSRGEFARAARVLLELTTGSRVGGRPSPSAASESTASDPAASSSSSGTGTTTGGASSLSWPTVLCGEEVAVYTAVLALATLPRNDVLLLAEHADALEAAPLFRECLRHFHRGQYTAGWHALPWDTHLALDVYLGPHIVRLKGLVVQRAILAYWQPYQRVDVATMARELHGMVPDPDSLLRHLVDVIAASHSPNGLGATSAATAGVAGVASAAPHDITISAAATSPLESFSRPDASAPLPKLLDTRIDLPARTLVRNPVEPDHRVLQVRAEARVRRLATQVLDDSYALVVRLACQEHGLAVAGGRGSDRRGGGPRPSSPAWNRRRGGGGGGRRGGPNPRRGRADVPQPDQDARGEREGLPDLLAAGGGGMEGPGRPGPEDVELDDLVSSEEDVYRPHEDDDDSDVLDDEHGMDDVADDMNPEDLY